MRRLIGLFCVLLTTNVWAGGIWDPDGKFGGVFSCKVTAAAGVEYLPYKGKWEAKTFPPDDSFTVTISSQQLGTEMWFDEIVTAYQYNVVVTQKGKSGTKCTGEYRKDENGNIKMTIPITNDGVVLCNSGFDDLRLELDGLGFEIKGEHGDLLSLTKIAMDTAKYVKVGTCERL